MQQIEPDEGLLNNLAWVLATSPDDKLRDGKRAIELATKAAEVSNYETPHVLSTLAAAYAETGDFEKAKNGRPRPSSYRKRNSTPPPPTPTGPASKRNSASCKKSSTPTKKASPSASAKRPTSRPTRPQNRRKQPAKPKSPPTKLRAEDQPAEDEPTTPAEDSKD